MQPWPDQGQNGADGHDAWQSGFAYPSEDGQYDPSQQQWPQQPMAAATSAYSQVSHDPQDGSAPTFNFDSAHPDVGVFLEDQHLTSPQPGQASFHGGGHGSMPLDQHQQFSPVGQDMLDPAFGNIHPDLFDPQEPQQPQQSQQQLRQQLQNPHQHQHQGKASLGGGGNGSGIGQQMGMAQGGQSHPHTHPQAFAQHDYSFPPQGGQPFDNTAPPTQVPQYAPPPLMPRPSRRQTHTPVPQHFDGNSNLHGGLSQNQVFATPSPQQSSVHQQQQPYPALGQPFAPPANGQPNRFQAGPHSHLNYQQFQESPSQPPHLQQARFQQPGFAPQNPLTYGPGSVGQVAPSQQQQQGAAGYAQTAPPQQPATEADPGVTTYATESPAKRRKRATRSAPDLVSTAEPVTPAAVDLSADLTGKRAEGTDALRAPVPTAEEANLMAESAKRGSSKAAQGKTSLAKALPFLAYDGSVKLPAPKSHDKLAPLVALPSRSGKPTVANLGYALPCEIQGKFTSHYKPSIEKTGLDERRAEAKDLLDDYDSSMKALGKRQPKYTEYPHAFKEQLKADEASKNKAEKRAKKEMEEERNKPIRAATRPADAVAAAAWDMVGIVYIDQSVARTSALIAGRVQQAGEFLIKLRAEANRAKLALDQAAKDKQPEAEVATLREEADQKKEMLYRALDATVEHADDSVLDNLGGHQKLVLSLVNILIASIKAGDFSGKLPKIVLELFTHLSMTKKIVETTNFDTVRKRLGDKGDDEVKDLVRKISSKVKKFTRSIEPETATGYTGTSAASRARSGTKPAAAAAASEPSSTAKRGRDDDSDTARTVKKIAIEPGSSSSLSKKLGQPKSHQALSSKAAAANRPSATTASSLLPGKSRPVAKAVSSRPGLELPAGAADSPSASSADEKSNKADLKKSAAAAAAAASAAAAATTAAAAAAAPKPAATSSLGAVSSISSLLDAINAKKPEAPAASASVASREGKRSQTPETAEQKAKRLRKEARRKLRVSWKPEGELVQIKVFEKDEDEDEGRDVNMIRDAADDRSEGMVLKRGAKVAMDDEDDDVPYRPWSAPAATDVSNLADDVRNKSYVTRGGRITFSTEEQKRIAEREQRELMVIYTDPADIPPTPKSPPPETAVPNAEVKIGQLPKDDAMFDEIQARWRDEEQQGPDEALHAAMKRLDAKSNLSNRLDSILGLLHQSGSGASSAATSQPSLSLSSPLSSLQATTTATTNRNVPLLVGPAVESYVLGWLRWNRMKSWRDPKPVHWDVARAQHYAGPDEEAGKAVEAVAMSLAGKPYPAVAPPEWLAKDGERVREWWLGFNKESAARQRRQDEERARAEAEANAQKVAAAAAGLGLGNAQDWGAYYAQQQQQAYAPYMALLQQMNGVQQQQQQQQQQPLVGGPVAQGLQSQIPDSQLQSILAAINQPSQLQQPPHGLHSGAGGYEASYQTYSQQQVSAQAGDWDEDRDEDQAGRGEQHRDKDVKDGRKKKGALPPHKPVNKALIGTKSCTFWQQGKCARGDKCTFRHD